MGGKSLEREVSLNSGRTICDHLDSARYDIIPLFHIKNNLLYILPTRFLHRGKISDFEARLEYEAQQITWDTLKNYVDIAYIAQHGRYGEDGCLQGLLEVIGVPYVGSKVFASALGMNKKLHKNILQAAGIKVPRGFSLEPHELETAPLELLLQEHNLTFPVIVKPEQEGSSFGIQVVYALEDLYGSLKQAATIFPKKVQAVIVEEILIGMEFSCIVLTDYITGELWPLSLPKSLQRTGFMTMNRNICREEL